MSILATLSNSNLSIDVSDHGTPSQIESLSDASLNLLTGYLMKCVWTYYDTGAVVTYPADGTLISSDATHAVVKVTGHADGYGNVVSITQSLTLHTDSIDVVTQVELTTKAGAHQLLAVMPVNMMEIILGGTGREAGEYVTTVGNDLLTSALGVYPSDVNAEYFRDGEHQMWLAVRQTGRWLGVLSVGHQYLRTEGIAAGTEPAHVRLTLEPRSIAFNAVSDIRYGYWQIIVRNETKSAADLRTAMPAAHIAWSAGLPTGSGLPSSIAGTFKDFKPGAMLVYSFGSYDPYADSIYVRDHYLASGDQCLVWLPARMFYANPSHNSNLVRILGFDPALLVLNTLRAKARTIIARVWGVSQYFADNPADSTFDAAGRQVLGYYGQPDGYPALWLMAQPDHAKMIEYWQDFTELADYYDFDILSIEEMYYVDTSYGTQDEAHYIAWVLANYGETVTGFPRVTKPSWYWRDAADDGKIVKFWDAQVIAWRNYCTRQFYTRCRDILHAHGKKLAVELRWSTQAGVYPEQLQATLEAGTLDVGWRSVAYWNAYDYTLIADGIVDLAVLWWYWDIQTTDLGGGSYATTNTPGDFTADYLKFLNNGAHVGGRFHLHVAPVYKGENITPIPDWWKYSLDKFQASLALYRRYAPFQISCNLGALPGLHRVNVVLSDVSQSDEAVIRGASVGDALRYWKDVVITKIGNTPGATDYIEGTDYQFVGTQLTWLGGGSAPSLGATYYVTYTAHDYTETYGVAALADADQRDYMNAWIEFCGKAALTL